MSRRGDTERVLARIAATHLKPEHVRDALSALAKHTIKKHGTDPAVIDAKFPTPASVEAHADKFFERHATKNPDAARTMQLEDPTPWKT